MKDQPLHSCSIDIAFLTNNLSRSLPNANPLLSRSVQMSVISMAGNSTGCTKTRNGMRDQDGLHYIVESLCRCAESLFYVIALLALRLRTGTKPKWQMGRKGRRSCDAWAEIFNRKGWLRACCSARRSAHWLLSRSHSAFIPPLLPEDACHVYYCTMNCRTFSNPLKKHHASVSKSLHRAWLIQSQEMNVLSPFFKVKKKKTRPPVVNGDNQQQHLCFSDGLARSRRAVELNCTHQTYTRHASMHYKRK